MWTDDFYSIAEGLGYNELESGELVLIISRENFDKFKGIPETKPQARRAFLDKLLAAAAPQASPSHAGVDIMAAIKAKLKECHVDRPDEHVLALMVRAFAMEMAIAAGASAPPDLALDLYRTVKVLPHTSTKIAIKKHSNIVVNGIWRPANITGYNCRLLLAANASTGEPLLLKVAIGCIGSIEEKLIKKLGLGQGWGDNRGSWGSNNGSSDGGSGGGSNSGSSAGGGSNNGSGSGGVGCDNKGGGGGGGGGDGCTQEVSPFVRCRIIDVPMDSDACQAVGLGMRTFRAIVMPLYPCTLADLPALHPAALVKGAQQLFRGLEIMHLKGYVHMDIKAGNILVEKDGTWVIADFGSTVKVGKRISSYTEQYYPVNLKEQLARVEYDFGMLVIMLAMLLCVRDPNGALQRLQDPSTRLVSGARIRQQLLQAEGNGAEELLAFAETLLAKCVLEHFPVG